MAFELQKPSVLEFVCEECGWTITATQVGDGPEFDVIWKLTADGTTKGSVRVPSLQFLDQFCTDISAQLSEPVV